MIRCSRRKDQKWRVDERGALHELGGLRALSTVAPNIRAVDNDDPDAFALALGKSLPRLRKLFVGLDRHSLSRVKTNGRWVPEVSNSSVVAYC